MSRATAAAMDEFEEGPAAEAACPEESGSPALVFGQGRAAFELAIAPVMPRLHRFCIALCRDRAEAEDLLQDGLVKAYLHAGSFQGRGDLFAWVCGILRNQFIETRRAAARRQSILDSVLHGCASVLGAIFSGGVEHPDPESSAAYNEEVSILIESLHRVPVDFRMVVLLCDVEGVDYESAAKILDVPVGTVKSRHARGRMRLNAAFRALQCERAARKGTP